MGTLWQVLEVAGGVGGVILIWVAIIWVIKNW